MEIVVTKYRLGEEPEVNDFWLDKTPQERIDAVTELRMRRLKTMPLEVQQEGLQRVVRIVNLKDS